MVFEVTRFLVKVPLPRAGAIPLVGAGDPDLHRVTLGTLWEDGAPNFPSHLSLVTDAENKNKKCPDLNPKCPHS